MENLFVLMIKAGRFVASGFTITDQIFRQRLVPIFSIWASFTQR
jgi:hypothetical protein